VEPHADRGRRRDSCVDLGQRHGPGLAVLHEPDSSLPVEYRPGGDRTEQAVDRLGPDHPLDPFDGRAVIAAAPVVAERGCERGLVEWMGHCGRIVYTPAPHQLWLVAATC